MSTNFFVTSFMTRDLYWHACLNLPNTETTCMAIKQDLIQHFAQTHVVIIIIRKSHQLLVINAITTQIQWKQPTKYVHQGPNSHLQILSHLRMTFRNWILRPRFFTIDPDYKSKTWLIHQYIANWSFLAQFTILLATILYLSLVPFFHILKLLSVPLMC